MNFVTTTTYYGPNRFVPFAVLFVRLDLGALEAWPTGRLGADYLGRLGTALPGLEAAEPGLFNRARAGRGVPLAEVVACVAVELQRRAGFAVDFFEARPARPDGQYDVLIDFANPRAGREAAGLAVRIAESLLPEDARNAAGIAERSDLDALVQRFQDGSRRWVFDPFTAALVEVAKQRDIPWRRLGLQTDYVRFGYGRNQWNVRQATVSRAWLAGTRPATDWGEQVDALQEIGLPVPRVTSAKDVEEAIDHGDATGFPLYVTPRGEGRRDGIVVRRDYLGGVAGAYHEACPNGGPAVVASYLEGRLYRLLAVGGRLVAGWQYRNAIRGHGIRDKVVNLDRVDAAAQAWSELAVAGGVHDDNRAVAEMAAGALGFDIACIEFVSPDIADSYQLTGGRIVRVDPSPDLGALVAAGGAETVAEAIMDLMYPPGAPSRIPTAVITGTNGKTTTTSMIARILCTAGYATGHCTTEGIFFNGLQIAEGDRAGLRGGLAVLENPVAEAASVEAARGGLVLGGMAADSCNVSCVLNVTADHLGKDGIETVDDLADIKRTVVTVAKDAVVLNGDDTLCVGMAPHAEAEKVCFATLENDNPVIADHLKAGGPVAMLEDVDGEQVITVRDGESTTHLVPVAAIPVTFGGSARHNVQNAMFAAAMTHFMGISPEHIRKGLETFGSTRDRSTGRLHVYDELPFRVILDYAHNVAGYEIVCETLRQFPVTGRRIGVVVVTGFSLDETFHDTARVVVDHFDYFICREDDRLYGRERGEATQRLHDALIAAGADEKDVAAVPEEQDAIATALKMAGPGDLVVVFGNRVHRDWDQITSFVYEGGDTQPTGASTTAG